MKLLMVFISSLFLFSHVSFANPFMGTWLLVSGEYKDSTGRLVPYKELNLSSIKVISEQHFSFITMSGEKFWSSGAGKYRFDDITYTEMPSHSSYGVKLGSEYVFTYKIENNTWRNARWENGERVEYELWRKVD